MTQPFGEIVQFASRNRGEGKLIEPRFYFDTLDFTTVQTDVDAYGATVPTSDPASYSNGEQFPVRLTHMIVSALHTPPSEATGNAIVYQRASGVQFPTLRVERYGEYYMNETFIRASAWHNAKTAQPYNLASGSVTHRFYQPLVLSARDSLRLEFEAVFPGAQTMDVPAPNAATVTVNASDTSANLPARIVASVTGVGMRSGRPYFLSGAARATQNIQAPSIFVCDPADFTNVGQEPIALTEITVNANVSAVSGDLLSSVPLLSDVRFFRMQMRQTGNGTQAEFFKGPTYPTQMKRMPLSLLGTDLGDAVVHVLPGEGIQLDPGEVVRVSGQNIAYADEDTGDQFPTLFAVGFAGYLMVT